MEYKRLELYIFFLLTSKRNVLKLNFKFGFWSPVRRRNIIHPNRTFLLLSSDNFQAFLHRYYTKELKSCLPHTGKRHKFQDFHCERYSANNRLPTAGGGGELEASGLQSPTKSGFTKHVFSRDNDIKISHDSPTAEISHWNGLMNGTLTFWKIREKIRTYLMKLKNKKIRRCDLN